MLQVQPHLTKKVQAYLTSAEFRQQKAHYSPEIIEKVLRYGAPFGCRIEQHASLPRCMDRLKELICSSQQSENPLPSGTVVIADQLHDSCGRFDRQWHAPKGGVWMAAAWADTLLSEFAGLLPLAAGIGCCETIRESGPNAFVKWVNDVHVDGRKIAGILSETVIGDHPEDKYHLIGIGINCNNTSFPQELRETATSLCLELEQEMDMKLFTTKLLANLAWNFGLVHLCEEQALARQRDGRQGTFVNPVIEEWKQVSDTLGRKVVYGYDVFQRPLYQAVVKDIDQTGGLIMQLDNGELVTENSGELIYLEVSKDS